MGKFHCDLRKYRHSGIKNYTRVSISIMHVSRAGLKKQELKRECFNNILFGADNPVVCTRKFNNKLFYILLIQRSRVVVFFLFLLLVSCRTLSHMTTNILFSRLTIALSLTNLESQLVELTAQSPIRESQ